MYTTIHTMCTMHIVLFLCTHAHYKICYCCCCCCVLDLFLRSYGSSRFFFFLLFGSFHYIQSSRIYSHTSAHNNRCLMFGFYRGGAQFFRFFSLHFFSFLYRVYLFRSIWSKRSCMCALYTGMQSECVCERAWKCVCVINIITKLFYAYNSMRQGVQVFARILVGVFFFFHLLILFHSCFSSLLNSSICLAQPVFVRSQ